MFDGAVIIVTHSEMILEAVATKLIVFDGGEVSVFEGTYFDFLERVGWQDEGGVRARNGKKKGADKSVNRKDAKKLRAGIVADKSKVLGSLKNRIAALEEEITKREQDMERDNLALAEASTKGDAAAIARLSKSVREAQQKIEALFAELEELTNEHDTKAKDFDGRLSVVS